MKNFVQNAQKSGAKKSQSCYTYIEMLIAGRHVRQYFGKGNMIGFYFDLGGQTNGKIYITKRSVSRKRCFGGTQDIQG